MSARFLLTSSLRTLPASRPIPSRSLLHSSTRRLAPPPDPQDAHGSVPSSRKLRPRDRLQFIEASEQAKEAAGEDAQTVLPEPDGTREPEPTVLPDPPEPPTSSPLPSASPASSSSEPPPPPSDTELVISPPVPGLPPLTSHSVPVARIPFSTHRFVRRLEEANVRKGMAEELMRATKGLLRREETRARDELLSKQDLENEAYIFTAALQDLKVGSQVKSRNDSITLKSLTASLQREVDAVEQKMKEDMQRLSSDIQLEMNARKEETGQELQNLDSKVMDLNSKFTILLSEVRTEIEATKWISTRRVMLAILGVVISVVAYFSSRSSSSKKSKSSSSSSSDSHPLSLEELGVQPGPGTAPADEELLPDGTPAGFSRRASLSVLVQG
ncbi:hypothetical protein JCM8097_000653 [Rhodosporidiobolus ruineniae]